MRNPDRLRNFLETLRTLQGSVWDRKTQIEFQIRLIQHRYYGYGSSQFYNNLTSEQVNIIKDFDTELTHAFARRIFQSKKYTDPPLRGRQSYNVLKKFGFVALDSKNQIYLTETGEQFLTDDYNLQDIFLRIMLKWQIPNPHNKNIFNSSDYNIIPFIGVLHLIRQVNDLEESNGHSSKGISKREFSLFGNTLTHHKDIESHAKQIVKLRRDLENISRQDREAIWKITEATFASGFLQSNDKSRISHLLGNLKDYGDNTIRYFRLTSFIRIRGGGFYVDLEERRQTEIDSLLSASTGEASSFQDNRSFENYIADPSEPTLPWDEPHAQVQMINQLNREIRNFESLLGIPVLDSAEIITSSISEGKIRISNLDARRRELQTQLSYRKAQEESSIKNTISILNGIFSYEEKPILLEKTATLGLYAFNDALEIKPQYPIGDDGEPTFTAPASTPDIECFYGTFNAICEVTMLSDRTQWFNEGQPVMRHLRDFEERYPEKDAYCLFIAPKIHRDTVNTFWSSVKFEYEGASQRIVPLTISQFAEILGILLIARTSNTHFQYTQIQNLFDKVLALTDSVRDSRKWMEAIPKAIEAWKEDLFK